MAARSSDDFSCGARMTGIARFAPASEHPARVGVHGRFGGGSRSPAAMLSTTVRNSSTIFTRSSRVGWPAMAWIVSSKRRSVSAQTDSRVASKRRNVGFRRHRESRCERADLRRERHRDPRYQRAERSSRPTQRAPWRLADGRAGRRISLRKRARARFALARCPRSWFAAAGAPSRSSRPPGRPWVVGRWRHQSVRVWSARPSVSRSAARRGAWAG